MKNIKITKNIENIGRGREVGKTLRYPISQSSIICTMLRLTPSLYYYTLRNIWANSNSSNHIWVVETASFNLGYNWKHLGTLEEFHSDSHILLIFGQITIAQIKFGQQKQRHSNLSWVTNISKIAICSGNPPFQLTLIFVNLTLLML